MVLTACRNGATSLIGGDDMSAGVCAATQCLTMRAR